MKKLISLLCAVVLLLSLGGIASADFNAKLDIDRSEAEIRVTVVDSDELQEWQPKLRIPCDFEQAYVTFQEEVVESVLVDGEISFTVAAGGTYVILQGEAPEDNTDDDNNNDGQPPEGNSSSSGEGGEDDNWWDDIVVVRPSKPSKKDEEPEVNAPWVNPFIDVNEDDWFYEYVEKVCSLGLIKGVEEDVFGVEEPVTRAMLVTILYRAAGEPTVYGDSVFSDVPDDAYYADAAVWAEANGIVSGYGDGRFGPNDLVTREQTATVLHRFGSYNGMASVVEIDFLTGYADTNNISNYAEASMNWAVGHGLLQGSDNMLMPQQHATRSQMAAILSRYLGHPAAIR